jgi:hypothetical protein
MAVWRDWRADLGLALMSRRFPPPWSVRRAFESNGGGLTVLANPPIDSANGQALACVYFEAQARGVGTGGSR